MFSFLKINEDGVGNKLQHIYADKMQKCEELRNWNIL